ncbi:MAG: hypothetical protein UX18_C0023G0015 [Candidatus Azambacteria bacterium GW2011_GWC2_45_7b]|uniref:Uncharacterized protein n=1 Tax=Candidatus Azambacteria bacterium GW2011_GWC2_45_7b TaxID=1618621 RepID=A0A837IQR1_9BACT|nr:MAG: hypothetical protein UX18_C0023G0015 [Candidatus Azambacteria bacterium GW2011_GWC2_45_7b]
MEKKFSSPKIKIWFEPMFLAKMSYSDERLRAPPKAGLRLKQNFLYDSFFARATNFFF